MNLLFGSFALWTLIGCPIFIAFAGASILYFYLFGPHPVLSVAHKMVLGIQSWPLLAIPFFMLMGDVFMRGGMGRRVLNLISAAVGWLPGGLAAVCVVVNMFMAGVSGAALADAVAIGSVLIPEMRRKGYPVDFIVALHATSATIGIIIPPSIPMIVYAWMTDTSVRDLFLAGVIPGLLIGVALILITVTIAWREGFPREPWPGMKSFLAQLLPNSLAFLAPVIVLGGIIFGVVTATEAAVLGCAYVLLVETLIYNELSFGDILLSLSSAAKMTGAAMMLLATAAVFGQILTLLRVPALAAGWMGGLVDSPWLLLLLINGWFLIQGCFIDLLPGLLLSTPIFLPLALQAGMDPIQFGVMLTIVLGIGLFTPPVGGVLFAVCVLGNTTIEHATPRLLPFLFGMLVVLLLVTYVPSVSLWLVRP